MASLALSFFPSLKKKMYTRAQIILALAVVACSLCLVLALPAADNESKIINKVRNPRLGGSQISKQLGKRDDTVFNIDLSESNDAAASSSSFIATAVPIASNSIAAVASTTTTSTTTTPTPIPTAATTTTHYTGTFTFTASLKDTNPLNDGLVYMASLSKKGKKKSKKSLASVKSALKASKNAGRLTGTAAAAVAAATATA